MCNFDPTVEDCKLDDLVGDFDPGSGVGQGQTGQGTTQEQLGSTSTNLATNTQDIPNLRTDIFSCTNKGCLSKQGNKSCYSGCKKKIFELSGKIVVAERQTGDLCEGLKTVGDGRSHFITNQLRKEYDSTAIGSVGCPCAPAVTVTTGTN